MYTWLEFALICIVCAVFPSIHGAIWRVRLSDRACAVLFPLRTLLDRKIVYKNDLMKFYTDVRTDGGVHLFAVIWYVFAYLAALFLLVAGFFLSEAGLRVFLNVVLCFFLLCIIPILIGVFTSDRKYRSRIRVEDADVDALHGHEEAIAYQISDAIGQDQEQMQALGYRWRVDILCTDRLDDKPIRSAMGTLSAFTGVAQTNPLYMSRATVTILDENDEPVPFPAKRRAEVDIAFTQNACIIYYHADYVVNRVAEIVHDITAMMVYRAHQEN